MSSPAGSVSSLATVALSGDEPHDAAAGSASRSACVPVSAQTPLGPAVMPSVVGGAENVRGDERGPATRVSVPSSALSAQVPPAPAATAVGVLPAG